MAHLRDEGIYGLKTGVFLNDNVEVEGSFWYIEPLDSGWCRPDWTIRSGFSHKRSMGCCTG